MRFRSRLHFLERYSCGENTSWSSAYGVTQTRSAELVLPFRSRDQNGEPAYLRREAGQQTLTLPVVVPLMSSAQLRRVSLQDGRRRGGLTGRLGGDGRKDVSVVVRHV